ncbi:MAG: 23S rRNA (adenine(2503)-C(2))-methyltransferase RlmN, partial [Bdellovibrionales bacterium]
VKASSDKTVKFLQQLSDSKLIETVLIPFNKKYTLCVSSQVGCLMNCSFCYTGKQGFTRNLATHEIVGQLLTAKKWLNDERPEDNLISNIVFMGQGEPLHNFDNVRDAIHIFISQHGLSLADHKITVSTSGYLPGLERWKSEMPSINVALSLHSIDNEKRSQIIPLNKKYPVNEILSLVESIPSGKKRFVTYEYLLIDDFNDSVDEANKLGEKLKGTKAFLNLIPFNPIPGSDYRRPSEEKIDNFMKTVSQFGFPVTRRSTKGDEILAACGQLNSKF